MADFKLGLADFVGNPCNLYDCGIYLKQRNTILISLKMFLFSLKKNLVENLKKLE